MGNRTRAETIAAGASQLTNYTYNIANQLISDGAQSFSYDEKRASSGGRQTLRQRLTMDRLPDGEPGQTHPQRQQEGEQV